DLMGIREVLGDTFEVERPFPLGTLPDCFRGEIPILPERIELLQFGFRLSLTFLSQLRFGLGTLPIHLRALAIRLLFGGLGFGDRLLLLGFSFSGTAISLSLLFL